MNNRIGMSLIIGKLESLANTIENWVKPKIKKNEDDIKELQTVEEHHTNQIKQLEDTTSDLLANVSDLQVTTATLEQEYIKQGVLNQQFSGRISNVENGLNSANNAIGGLETLTGTHSHDIEVLTNDDAELTQRITQVENKDVKLITTNYYSTSCIRGFYTFAGSIHFCPVQVYGLSSTEERAKNGYLDLINYFNISTFTYESWSSTYPESPNAVGYIILDENDTLITGANYVWVKHVVRDSVVAQGVGGITMSPTDNKKFYITLPNVVIKEWEDNGTQSLLQISFVN